MSQDIRWNLENHSNSTLGIFLGPRLYFTVYLSSRHNTDTILLPCSDHVLTIYTLFSLEHIFRYLCIWKKKEKKWKRTYITHLVIFACPLLVSSLPHLPPVQGLAHHHLWTLKWSTALNRALGHFNETSRLGYGEETCFGIMICAMWSPWKC